MKNLCLKEENELWNLYTVVGNVVTADFESDPEISDKGS
jgi:hypothetical protein